MIRFSVTFTPCVNLFSSIIPLILPFLTPVTLTSFNSGKSSSLICKKILLSSIFNIYTSILLKRLESHNFLIALLIFTPPGIVTISPFFNPE